ncbi:MAG: hypothetical protein PHH40_03115 [Candidatus Moranbacteria bacterium]|nr:hypothetical protein [Candidatus Moranbacteria bacterium]MDD3965406.1 hypothetical protein [Candidatus Moranbacteria bacterium]
MNTIKTFLIIFIVSIGVSFGMGNGRFFHIERSMAWSDGSSGTSSSSGTSGSRDGSGNRGNNNNCGNAVGGSTSGARSGGGGNSRPVVPPCSALNGRTCTSVANACGTTSGTYNCAGVCSATPPALPTGYGTACQKTGSVNSCGDSGTTTSGVIVCNGTCDAPAPTNAQERWYRVAGVTCLSAPNQCGKQNLGTYNCSGTCAALTPSPASCSAYNTNKPTVSLKANPLVLTSERSTILTWTIANATSCRHSSDDSSSTASWTNAPIDPADGSTSVSVTAPTTSFTISCSNASGVTNRTVYVKIQNDCSGIPACGDTNNVCDGKRYNDIKGCGVNNCRGTRYCDLNWKETAPGQ